MNVDPTCPQFEWLSSLEAQPFLEQAKTEFEERRNAVSIAKRLRKKLTPTQAALVMEQAQLRIRAVKKFSMADQMLFTRRGLEQASSQELAAYKAKRFSGIDRVADVCCGIGGDLMGLAQRDESTGQTVGIDRDPVTALFARHNASLLGLDVSRLSVQETDFEQIEVDDFDGWHLDPDRRQSGRTVLGHRFSPSLVDVVDRLQGSDLVAVKVAPATPHQPYFPEEMAREWIGDRRECKQQVLWWGGRRPLPPRTATMVLPTGQVHQFSSSASSPPAGVIDAKPPFLHEPHPTLLAAGLTDDLAHEFGAKRVCPEIPYLVTDDPRRHPLLASFEILEVLKLDPKLIEEILRGTSVGNLEIKRRGIDQVTANRMAKIKLEGDLTATIILTRVGPSRTRRALLARRLVEPIDEAETASTD